MGTFGFSYIGLLYLLMLYIPNLIWAKNQPEGYTPQGENKILLVFERTGQVLCSTVVLIFKELKPVVSYWGIWLLLSFLCM